MVAAEVGPVAALLAGFLSFLSPCVLPLVPAYLSLVTGLTIEELGQRRAQKRILFSCVLFVLGFSLIFVLMGATASTFGRLIVKYRRPLNVILGLVVVMMGLFLADLIRIPALYRVKRITITSGTLSRLGPIAAMAVGLAFALGWTPCVGPVLASILACAASRGTLGTGIVLLSAYSIGLGAPFVVTGLSFSRALVALEWFKKNQRMANAAAGLLLAVMGLLLVFDALGL